MAGVERRPATLQRGADRTPSIIHTPFHTPFFREAEAMTEKLEQLKETVLSQFPEQWEQVREVEQAASSQKGILETAALPNGKQIIYTYNLGLPRQPKK